MPVSTPPRQRWGPHATPRSLRESPPADPIASAEVWTLTDRTRLTLHVRLLGDLFALRIPCAKLVPYVFGHMLWDALHLRDVGRAGGT